MSLDPDNNQKLDEIEAQLRQSAEAADETLTPEDEIPELDGEEAAPEAEVTPKSDEIPKTEEKPKEEQEPPDSSYTKAKKDGERLDRSWKKLEEQKAELERRERELAERQTAPKPEEPKLEAGKGEVLRDQHGNSAADYRDAAKALRDRGDDDLAAKAEAAANDLETRGRQQAQEGEQQAYRARWEAEAEKVIKAESELANHESPLAVKVRELLESGPFYHVFENGFPMAVETASLHLRASQVETLRAENERLIKENKELRDATSIDGSDPAPPAGARVEITEAQLRALAEAQDAVAA